MHVERITSSEDPRIEGYRATRDGVVARSRGSFLAEGRLVVRSLLEHGLFRARSVLATGPALESIADAVEAAGARWGEPPVVYEAEQRVMDAIAGFPIHRGCLAEGARGRIATASEVVGGIDGNGVVVVLEGVNNHDNVGGIFRSALALGARAVVIDPGTVDPLYRKAIRVSIGGVLRVPWGATGPLPEGLSALRAAGFRSVALTPGGDAQEIGAFVDRCARERGWDRIALVVGAEGSGVTRGTVDACDARVKISMAPEVDSLNVATAAAIALHRLRRDRG